MIIIQKPLNVYDKNIEMNQLLTVLLIFLMINMVLILNLNKKITAQTGIEETKEVTIIVPLK